MKDQSQEVINMFVDELMSPSYTGCDNKKASDPKSGTLSTLSEF